MSEYPVLKDLAIIFAVSLLVILLFHRIKLPALPGFIVAGVLLGPNALGLVSDAHQLESLAEVGVFLLLFTIGIEFSLSRLREMGRQVVVGGGAQVGLTVVLTYALALTLRLNWRVSLLLGFLVALSSTAIVLRVLVLARTVVPRALTEILKTRSRELFLIAVILIGTLTALGTAAAGASLALGAFLAGLIISESDYGHQALAELMPFRDVFISLFFVAVGVLVRLDVIRDHIVLTLVAVAVIM